MVAGNGSYPWKTDGREQKAIGVFVNELKKIHEESSQHDESLKRIINSFGYIYDTNDCPSEVEGTPIKDSIKKAVFEG